MASGPITYDNRWEKKVETVTDFIFLDSKITVDGDCSHEIKRQLLLGRKVMTNLDSVLKSRDITLPAKVCLVKAMVFPIVMYGCELDRKEGWVPKNWCFQTVVLEKTVESPFGQQGTVKPLNPKGNQYWIFIGRTDTEDEALIILPSGAKNWLPRKDPDAAKDCGQEDKQTTEDETVGWHHWLNGHEFEQALGVSDGSGSLARCSSRGCKESDRT